MKRNLRKLVTLFLAALMLFGCAFTAFARGEQAPHYIKVQMRYDHKKLDHSVKVQLHRIGDVIVPETGTDLTFSLNDKFKGCGLQLNDIFDVYKQDNSDIVYKYVLDNNISADQTTNSVLPSSDATFENVPDGLYLVSQVITEETLSDAKGKFYVFDPYLVSMPSPVLPPETVEVGGGLSWSLSATPKCEQFDPIVLEAEKVWKDAKPADYEKLQITVQFIGKKDGFPNRLSEKIVLNKSNDWKYSSAKQNIFYPSDYEWTIRELEVPDGYKESYPEVQIGDFILGNTHIKMHTLTVENKKIPPKPPLIQTGQLNWPVPLLAGLGLALIVTGVVVSKNGRKKEQ